jgi:hypothetical protein
MPLMEFKSVERVILKVTPSTQRKNCTTNFYYQAINTLFIYLHNIDPSNEVENYSQVNRRGLNGLFYAAMLKRSQLFLRERSYRYTKKYEGDSLVQ